MKVLHICVGGPYTDGWNYQENMLVKFQMRAGHQVALIAAQWAWGSDGKTQKIFDEHYIDKDGVEIYRLPIKGDKDVFYRYKRFLGFYKVIEQFSPEIIFVHNIQFFDIDQIVRYAKTHTVLIYVDNHADFSNSARTVIARIFYKTIWRHYAKMIEPYTTKFFGVLPSRVDFLKNIYELSPEKCELLVLGGDDELIAQAARPEIKDNMRRKYEIKQDDFLIVTGGKIDAFKTQTLLLMEAVKNMNNSNIKLLVFGSVEDAYKDEVEKYSKDNHIIFVGFIPSEESYFYFAMADLVVFPGRHSIFWEQVVAQGIPMICKYWEGTTHIDIGGNVEFLMKDSVEEIEEKLRELIECPEKYDKMKNAAMSQKKKEFSYKKIAAKAIGD